MEQAAALGRVGFIGAGRVGRTLALALQAAGVQVWGLAGRGDASALQAGLPSTLRARSAADLVAASDTVFITVGDDAIGPVCAGLAWRAGQRVLHCSGATELAVLEPARAQGARVAGFHPLHTFGDVEVALRGLPGSAVAVEAEPSEEALWFSLAQALGCRPFTLPPGCRALYHASAHYAGSFVVALLREATQMWKTFGVDEEQALAALLPLLGSTARAAQARGLAPGMAGCIARGDAGTLQRHLQALQVQAPQAADLYRRLSRLNVPLALEKGSIDDERARRLLALLDEGTSP